MAAGTGNDKILEGEELERVANIIIVDINRLLINENFIFYVGATGQDPINEVFRWLTQRGRPKRVLDDGTIIQGSSKQRNRPVLIKNNGEVLSMKAAKEHFQYTVVYESQFSYNVLKVEEKLQAHFNNLPLGKKLWRCVAKSGSLKDSAIKSVFLTHTTKTLKEMDLKIQK